MRPVRRLLLCATALLAAASAPAEQRALVGGTLLDGSGGPPLANSVILIDDERITAVGQVGTLEVPAGVMAALEIAFGQAGTPAVSLWARVPHYVAGMPFPEASAVLVEGLADIAGLTLDSTALRRAADSSRRQVDQLIAGSSEHEEMVRKLEESIDASEGNAMGVEEVPSGDEIAAELERFLRGEDQ